MIGQLSQAPTPEADRDCGWDRLLGRWRERWPIPEGSRLARTFSESDRFYRTRAYTPRQQAMDCPEFSTLPIIRFSFITSKEIVQNVLQVVSDTERVQAACHRGSSADVDGCTWDSCAKPDPPRRGRPMPFSRSKPDSHSGCHRAFGMSLATAAVKLLGGAVALHTRRSAPGWGAARAFPYLRFAGLRRAPACSLYTWSARGSAR